MSKPYLRPMPKMWWNRNRAYRLFMLRELSSLFVALFSLEQICLAARAAAADGDPAARVGSFLAALAQPHYVLFHVIALAFVLLHVVTWFNLTPRVLVVRFGEEKLPDVLIAGAHYALWFVVSIVMGIWIVY